MDNLLKTFKKSLSFTLDKFQDDGIQKIYNEESILVTAKTGSGKSVFMDFCIELAHSKNKKLIITTPIKTLSNQKFHEYSNKYPHISFGILTGDIRFNPDAECLIMTTEILRNLLYKRYTSNKIAEKNLPININFDEVDSIIFDEIHFINDLDRGKVWEESIIMLPKSIKLIMLSATIDKAEEFGEWVTNIKGKFVNVISNNKRPIPLTYSVYYFTKFPKKCKKMKHLFDNGKYIKAVSKMSRKKMTTVLESDCSFQNAPYQEICNLINFERKEQKWYNDIEVLNTMIHFLQKKHKLPALFFIFSRKKCELYASQIQSSLNTPLEQQQVLTTINYQLKLLANPDIYINDPKLYQLQKLLVKGIAIHHSGLLPVYKEIIEILYSVGLIKVLFATETFAVGVNMPTKTVIFTSLQKYTKEGRRMLYSHEFNQLSGRAGRRGLDTHGNVIILANMFRVMPSCHEMSSIMAGRSQHIQSKFTFNYQFILKTILANDINLHEFIGQTLLKKNIKEELLRKETRLTQLNIELENLGLTIDRTIFDEYYNLENTWEKKNKRSNAIDKIFDFHKQYKIYLDTYELFQEQTYLKLNIPQIKTHLNQDQMKSIQYLIENQYLKDIESLTIKGLIASQVNECNEIQFTEALINGVFDDLNEIELSGILGVFCCTRFQDEDKRGNIENLNLPKKMKNKLVKLQDINALFRQKEENKGIRVNNDWELNLDMVEYTYYWANGYTYQELEFVNFEGNFVRDMIRIDNIAKDLVDMAEMIGKLDLMNKASLINNKIIRDIVTVDSIYIRSSL